MDSADAPDQTPEEVVAPIEVVAQIFSYLDLPSKQLCRFVCSEWNTILMEFFTSFTAHLNRDTWNTFSNSNLVYESVTVSNLMSSELGELLPEWQYSAKLLVFAPFELSLSARQWEPFRCGKWLPSVSAQQIAVLLSRCYDLERLVFLRNSLLVTDPITVNNICLDKLTHLEIEFSYDPSLIENARFKEISSIPTPALSHLSLQMRISLCSHDEALEFYYSLFSMIVSKKTSLEFLSFSFDVVIFPFDQSPTSQVATESDITLREEISDVQLKELRFSFCLHESVAPFNLGSHLLSNQKNLRTIQASLLNGCTHLYPLIKQAIESNSTTLTNLSVENGSYPGKNLKAELLDSVSSCHNLQFLQFSRFKVNSLSEAFRPNIKSLVRLELAGSLHPRVLGEIKMLDNLKYLKFWYNMSVEVNHYLELEIGLKEITYMPRLLEIKLLVAGLVLDFLLDEPRVKVFGNRNGLHECTVIILRNF